MRWFLVLTWALNLTACIYTDSPVIESRDVVVSPRQNALELGNDWSSIDVTETKIISDKGSNPDYMSFIRPLPLS